MRTPFRVWLVIAAMLAFALPAQAQAQDYPNKVITLVVPVPPGGAADFIARTLGQKLQDVLGQPVVISNRGGASGTIASDNVAKAQPDGYTILLNSITTHGIGPHLYTSLPYDSVKDFAPVTLMSRDPYVVALPASLPSKTVKEFIALANARQGKLLFGSTGALTSTHLGAERFRAAAGIRAQHVGFKGQSEFLIEIMADRIHFGAPGLTTALPMIKDGKLTPLLVATPQRSPALPDVPSAGEALPAWSRDGSQAWFAPAGTPRAIRQQISRELARQLARPEVKERLNNLAFQIAHTTPEEHEKNLRADLETFSRIVRETGMKPR